MKILGICLIAAAGLIFSQTTNKKYTDRLKADKVLKTIITDCINIIQNYPLSVDDIFKRFAVEEYKPFDLFFKSVLKSMQTSNLENLSSLSSDNMNFGIRTEKTLKKMLTIFDETDTEVILGRLKLLLKEMDIALENDRTDLVQKGELNAKLILLADLVLMIILI